MKPQYKQSVWCIAPQGKVTLPGGETTGHQHVALEVKVGQRPCVGVQHMLRLHGGMVKQGYLEKRKIKNVVQHYYLK